MTNEFELALLTDTESTMDDAVEDVLGILERSTGQTRQELIAQALSMWIGVHKPLSNFANAALQTHLAKHVDET